MQPTSRRVHPLWIAAFLTMAGMVLSPVAQADGDPSWALLGPRNSNVRGSVTFFYRSNELTEKGGYSSFGPSFQLRGSLGSIFYSAQFSYNRRERLAGNPLDEGAEGTQILGGARVGFRLGSKSLLELEYRNDHSVGLGNPGSVLFLNHGQQESLSGVERATGYMFALHNNTKLGSTSLSTSVLFSEQSSDLDGPGPAKGDSWQFTPDYLRRLEVRQKVAGNFHFLGKHFLEGGGRFVLDQIQLENTPEMTASVLDSSSSLEAGSAFRTSNAALFIQDRWLPFNGWQVSMAMAYELPGARNVTRRSEWSAGISRRSERKSLEAGITGFLRKGFPQWVALRQQGRVLALDGLFSGSFQDSLELGNEANASDFGGFEFFLGKAWGRHLEMSMSYTFSQLWSRTELSDTEIAFGTIEADVPSLASLHAEQSSLETLWEQSHLVHFQTSFRVNPSLRLGSSVSYLHTNPLEFVTAEILNTTPNPENESPVRNNLSLDFHLEKLVPVGNTEVSLMVDLFNVLDMGNYMAFDPRYDLELASLGGRRLQVGMRYGF